MLRYAATRYQCSVQLYISCAASTTRRFTRGQAGYLGKILSVLGRFLQHIGYRILGVSKLAFFFTFTGVLVPGHGVIDATCLGSYSSPHGEDPT